MIVFSHANSFPACTYRVLFKSLRARGFAVKAIEKFGHDPRYPVSDNWPHLVEQLADFSRSVITKTQEPVWLVGHSLGGYLSLMVAAKHPELARGVVLVDSPLLGGWRSKAFRMMKSTQMVGSLSPGAVSRKRRNSWPSVDAALEHFQHKKAFSRWDPEVLADYVQQATYESDGNRRLSFDRDIETQLYNTVPDKLDRLLSRHPLRCPVAFIGGRASQEMQQVGMAMTAKISQGRIMMLDGSHLFPMEKPIATAAAIEAAIRSISE